MKIDNKRCSKVIKRFPDGYNNDYVIGDPLWLFGKLIYQVKLCKGNKLVFDDSRPLSPSKN